MNVLSLFDGMSCGQLALERAGLPVENYYASEIDKYAITVTQKNYPDTIQLGDIRDWRNWELPKIDLIIGGSPCQGFSFAGKQLNFNDPRSKLFFTYAEILYKLQPKYFLLENVRMRKEHQDIITSVLGVKPILINSALVSAQNRQRLYWTNIPGITQPMDRGILLKDIVHENCLVGSGVQRTQILESYKVPIKQTLKLLDSEVKKPKILLVPRGNNSGGLRSENGKVGSLTSNSWEHNNFLTYNNGISWRKLTPIECERLQTLPDGYTEGVSNTQRYKMLGNGWTVDVIAHILKGLEK